VTQRPKHSYQPVEKQIPKVFIEAVETVVEVPAIVQEEQPVEVPEVQVVECITQVSCPVLEFREKAVPSIQTQVVEREVQVPQLLQEDVCVVVPEVQVAEVIREEPDFREEIITKEIPKLQMEYIERVEEIYGRVEQTNLPVGLQSMQAGFQFRGVQVDAAGGGLATAHALGACASARAVGGGGLTQARPAGVEYVSHGGVQLPFYQEHHLRTLSPAQLRDHATLLYRTLGYHIIGEMVPAGDHELQSWIMRINGLHLKPLLASLGLGGSTVDACGSSCTISSASAFRGTGVIDSTRVLGGANVVGGTRGFSMKLPVGRAGVRAVSPRVVGGRAVSRGVRSSGTAQVFGGGAGAGLAARTPAGVGLIDRAVTDEVFNMMDRNQDGKISRSEFRWGCKLGIVNPGPAVVPP